LRSGHVDNSLVCRVTWLHKRDVFLGVLRAQLPPLLEYLFNLGRQTGDAWIAQNGDALGQRSTMDLQQLLPGSIWNNI
jgi:hypothetical protein